MPRYTCIVCHKAELGEPNEKYLLAPEIHEALQCPKCGSVQFLLNDQILCTAEDYQKRIRKHYQKN